MVNGENVVKRREKQKSPANDNSEVDRLLAVIGRAENGDQTALNELRKTLADFPWLISALGGDLAMQAEAMLVGKISKQPTVREALSANMNALRTELAGEKPNPIERLLVERVIACWLQVAYADSRIAGLEQCSIQEGDYFQRQQDRAHRRYLSALKMLAVVRRLALPIRVDLNVAGRVETQPSQSTTSPRLRWPPMSEVN
jgi:hypothetical protein